MFLRWVASKRTVSLSRKLWVKSVLLFFDISVKCTAVSWFGLSSLPNSLGSHSKAFKELENKFMSKNPTKEKSTQKLFQPPSRKINLQKMQNKMEQLVMFLLFFFRVLSNKEARRIFTFSLKSLCFTCSSLRANVVGVKLHFINIYGKIFPILFYNEVMNVCRLTRQRQL